MAGLRITQRLDKIAIYEWTLDGLFQNGDVLKSYLFSIQHSIPPMAGQAYV
jgi:hypothetical protein